MARGRTKWHEVCYFQPLTSERMTFGHETSDRMCLLSAKQSTAARAMPEEFLGRDADVYFVSKGKKYYFISSLFGGGS